MEIHPFKALYPKVDKIKETTTFFKDVKYTYLEFLEHNFFAKQDIPSFYIQQIRKKGRTHLGVIGCLNIEDFLEGRIKKHENIIEQKEQRQVDLLKQRSAIVKPILLAHPKLIGLKETLSLLIDRNDTFIELPAGNEEDHLLWMISQARDIKLIQNIFHNHLEYAYLADGHHRTSASAHLYQQEKGHQSPNRFQFIPCGLFSFDQVEVFDFNRILELKKQFKEQCWKLFEEVGELQPLLEPKKPQQKHVLTICWDNQWYRFKWKAAILSSRKGGLEKLDVSLLEQYIIQPLQKLKAIKGIDFVEGSLGLQGLIDQHQQKLMPVTFCMYPLELEEIQKVADKNGVLPPKSTWFEPRLKNGVLVMEV